MYSFKDSPCYTHDSTRDLTGHIYRRRLCRGVLKCRGQWAASRGGGGKGQKHANEQSTTITRIAPPLRPWECVVVKNARDSIFEQLFFCPTTVWHESRFRRGRSDGRPPTLRSRFFVYILFRRVPSPAVGGLGGQQTQCSSKNCEFRVVFKSCHFNAKKNTAFSWYLSVPPRPPNESNCYKFSFIWSIHDWKSRKRMF